MGDPILFFYGTLMTPQILHRVIHGQADPEPWQKALLTIKPAILHNYRRHRVQGADYPGIVPVSEGDDTGAESRPSVLGTVVWGLTDGDVFRLDRFEGSEYEKRVVRVRVLDGDGDEGKGKGGGEGEEERVRGLLLDAAEGATEGKEVEAVTYVWTAGEERLEAAEWDFEAFKRDKLAWWVGADEEYA
ncbi:gamma-glutamylcyclotransferase family protein [Aspergillus ibericus CBS 121593]|uniref:Putative gamma-glutamylcyclotransferase n=1 Tax=Aspergillus ibericus CBS 121593 TaxID=1448316 RepID=A0A395H2M7_9EURO|nr:hypothetical protein BO80DRAFT_404929 [Aspergillus ibericus CBS 121593]RAL01913.1 hypothetical protein BO80DRAFT_404929 [Aspergillus ibericus CBS 121593]